MDGNRAAAYGVLLSRPDVICAYPITPQTPLLEHLYRFCAEGRLKAETVEVEGEHSAISVLIGAAASGARTFTATSSQGLAFMFEAYFMAATLRLPIVMVVATREMIAPSVVASGQQDIMTVRDAGWVQLHAASVQEILDCIIMAYRLAEDPDVLLPVNVCYDGYYLSHLSQEVEVPSQEDVDSFLPPPTFGPRLDPAHPMTFAVYTVGDLFTEYRYKHCAAMERARRKIPEIEAEFARRFGRSYGGLVERYRLDDAEIALVAMGSCAETAKVVVDRKREEGIPVGLARVRVFRPFPKEELRAALRGIKALGVLDRDVCFGWGCGALFIELKAAVDSSIPVLNFIGGLAGSDITLEHFSRAVESTLRASRGESLPEVTWLDLE